MPAKITYVIMQHFPTASPFDRGYLKVDDIHSLYFEQYGNEAGAPVVYLHGGPGAGCSFNEYRYFNPSCFRVILFDQRGAGKSTPYAEIANNSIDHLIKDLELLKKHLNIRDKWFVVGGSWGSALALLYAKQYPFSVERLLLRATFFADTAGANHIIEAGGANLKRNDYFPQYRDFIPPDQRKNGLKVPYYNLLTHATYEQQLEAAKRFFIWDQSIATHEINHEMLNSIEDAPETALAISRIFFHFAMHDFRDSLKRHILEYDDLQNKIPTDIIHGTSDMICPIENSQILHEQRPHSRFYILPNTGHSMAEVAMQEKFLEITGLWESEL